METLNEVFEKMQSEKPDHYDFYLNRKELINAIKAVSPILLGYGKKALPENGYVSFTANSSIEEFTVVGASIGASASVRVWANFIRPAEDKKIFCLPLNSVKKVIAAMKSENVYFLVADNRVTMKCGSITAIVENFKRYIQQFSQCCCIVKILAYLKSEEISGAIKTISSAVSREDSRRALEGVCIGIRENRMDVVGTDGKHLMIKKLVGTTSQPVEKMILVHRNFATFLSHFPNPSLVRVSESDSFWFFESSEGRFRLSVKKTNDCFPRYNDVIPDKYVHRLFVESIAVSFAVGVSDKKNLSGVCCEVLENGIKIDFKSEDFYTSTKIPARVESGVGEKFRISEKYFKKVLKIGSEIEITWTNANAPLVMSSGSMKLVIMPIRNR